MFTRESSTVHIWFVTPGSEVKDSGPKTSLPSCWIHSLSDGPWAASHLRASRVYNTRGLSSQPATAPAAIAQSIVSNEGLWSETTRGNGRPGFHHCAPILCEVFASPTLLHKIQQTGSTLNALPHALQAGLLFSLQ